MVRTPRFHCRGHGLDHCWRKFRSHILRGEAKNQNFQHSGCFLRSAPSEVGRRVRCCLATARQPGSGSSLMGNTWGHHLGTVSHPHQASFPISKMKCSVSTRFGKTGIVRLGSRTRSQLRASGGGVHVPLDSAWHV